MRIGQFRALRAPLEPLLSGFTGTERLPTVEISGICHDSRAVRSGDLFAALAGSHVHGMSHAPQAIRQGSAAIVFEPEHGGAAMATAKPAVPAIPVESLAQKLGYIADRFFGKPSKYITAIGITGTNGKTSCSHFLAQSLAARNQPAAVMGTLGWGRPCTLRPTTHTTPDAIEIHETLLRLYSEGFRYVAMEASSHGLAQGRLNGVRFRGALFTNFSRDHLDYHGTMEAYLDAKLRLLDWPGLEFVAFNADDPIAGTLLEHCPKGLRTIAFSVTGKPAATAAPLLTVSGVHQGAEGIAFTAHYQERSAPVHAPVFGDFNLKNLAAALSVLLAMGRDLHQAAESLQNVRSVPGRMESFAGSGRTVVVDYAHTPDALENVLASLRGHCSGRLWVVFGCGGDRDRGKRPEMGAIAERLADVVILTDDNPRSEDGDEIIREIEAGLRRNDHVVIRDRRDAIGWALERAAMDDLVLVAGKGHETTQEIQGQKHPFDDREVIRETLEHLGGAL